MRKMLFALIVVASTAMAASAQWNGPPAPCNGGNCGPGGGSANIYGWNHDFTKCIFWWRKNCNGKPNCAPGATPGTLVFPQHQFIRGPRDYFMWEPQR
jgi:hypothetical protein